MKIILNSFIRTLDFKGRSSRKELIFYMLFLVILILIAFIIDTFIFKSKTYHSQAIFQTSLYMRDGIIFFFLISLIPLIFLSIRRLHDINLSGLFIGIPIVVEIGLRVADEVLMIFEYTDNFIGIVGILIFIGLVILCTQLSHKKNNKYGKYIP